jgi:hypothetical protein
MAKRSTSIFLAFLNLVGFLALVAVNALASLLPINNKSTGELSDQYPNLFVPSGLTFSIWGVIYMLLAVYVIYNLVFSFRKTPGNNNFPERVGILFFISSVFNVGWILAWHYEIVWLSLLIMAALFITLLIIYLRLGIGRTRTGAAERGMVHIPFSVYLGWITIATIANVTALLVSAGWDGFGLSQQFWAVLVICTGLIIGLAVLFSRNDIYYALVIDWAFLGIFLKRMAETSVQDQAVMITSITGVALITAGIVIQLIRKKILY